MDSFELSKIAGAIFAALLLIFVPKTIIEMRKSAHEAGKEGYQLPVSESEALPADAPADSTAAASPGEPGTAPAAAPTGFDAKAVVAMIASASADDGKAQFAKCRACHTVEKDAANKVGPNLWNIVGRNVGGMDGFSYSAAMKGKGGTWDLEHLAIFVHKPSAAVPGTKMVFPGIKDNAALANLLAYIGTLR